MDRNVKLAIDVQVDAKRAAAGFDDVGDSAKAMARDVDRASDNIDRSTRNVADSVDNVGSSSSQAAGGVGDLGGALSMLPGPLGAVGAGMESVAPAIMGVTGAADLMALAMNSSAVTTAKDTVAKVAHRGATIATTVATKAQTIATKALNLAMRANPIGLVIAAVALLVGGFVLLYRRSSRVRDIVDKVWAAIKTAGVWIADLARKVGGFLLKWSPLGVAIRLVRDNFGQVSSRVSTLRSWLADKLSPALGTLKATASRVGQWLKNTFAVWVGVLVAPFEALWKAIQRVVEWLGKIKVPGGLSKLGGALGKVFGAAPVTRGLPQLAGGVNTLDPRRGVTAAAGVPNFDALMRRAGTSNAQPVQLVDARVFVNVDGALDPSAVGEQLVKLLSRTLRTRGIRLEGLTA